LEATSGIEPEYTDLQSESEVAGGLSREAIAARLERPTVAVGPNDPAQKALLLGEVSGEKNEANSKKFNKYNRIDTNTGGEDGIRTHETL
jgi:hypothetical protein